MLSTELWEFGLRFWTLTAENHVRLKDGGPRMGIDSWRSKASVLLVVLLVLLPVLGITRVEAALAASQVDLSVPPSLVSFSRTSADIANNGGTISIDWVVADVPVTDMIFYFRDTLGRDHQVRWDGPAAFSGTAKAVVDTSQWAAGKLVLWGVGYGNGFASIDQRSNGAIYKNPTGLQDPKPATLDFNAATAFIGPIQVLTASPVPTVTGQAVVGQTLTAVPGVWSPAPVTLSFQWQRDGVTIDGATASTYALVPADAGTVITVVVSGSELGFVSQSQSSVGTASVLSVLSAAPVATVTGQAVVGQTLTALPGVWSPAPVILSFQWQRDGDNIDWATASTYALVPADAGTVITVVVSGSLPGYLSQSRSSEGTPAVLSVLTAAPVPTVTGQAVVGQTLTAVPGSWTPAPVTLSFQWRRDGATIDGATSSTYALVPADAGTVISVVVSGSRLGYVSQSQVSVETEAVLSVLTASPVPTVTGEAIVGQTLTAVSGLWGPTPVAVSFQWQRDGHNIDGATASNYALVPADAGTVITVVVSGSLPGYLSQSRSSEGTAAVLSVLTSAPVPTVTGKAVVGQTLTVVPGSWTPAPVALSFQWKRDGVTIDGATASTYALVPADQGATVTVTVMAVKTGYVIETKSSAGTAAVLPTLSRLSGTDRFATSAAISAASFDPGVPVVYIANGYNFPDALSAAPVAGKAGAPVLLVSADSIPAAIQAELTRLKPGRIVVLGGVNAVSDAVTTALQSSTVGTVTRLSGADRFATSAAISAASFDPGVPVVYIANGYNFPDALSAAPVAGKAGAPVLLVSADSIPAAIQAELTRLKPGRIVVLGGVNAVSDAVTTALQNSTVGTVTRLSGADRFATSAAISAASFDPGVPVVYIANGYNFPDALSAAPVAGKAGAPVLLVSADSIPAAIQAELTRLKPGRIVVLGGVNAVSDGVSQQLISYIPK